MTNEWKPCEACYIAVDKGFSYCEKCGSIGEAATIARDIESGLVRLSADDFIENLARSLALDPRP